MTKYLNGVIIVVFVTVVSYIIQSNATIKAMNLSTLIIAIIIGALIKNTVGTRSSMRDGIEFCSKSILRLAVVMLGFRFNLTEISKIGLKPVILTVIVSTVTFIFVGFLGKKMGVNRNLYTLIGVGTSVCGASAIAAINTIIKSDDEEVAYSIGCITLYGTIFMLIYPLLFNLLPIKSTFYPIWVGSSIHEVAQVVAAGFAISHEMGTIATLIKLVRVFFIAPITIYLSLVSINKKGKLDLTNISVPWFVLLFICVVIMNTALSIPIVALETLIKIDGYLMAVAMSALGLNLSLSNIKHVGFKPLYLGLASSIFISVLSASVIKILKIA